MNQIKDGDNPVSLTLVETLLGLVCCISWWGSLDLPRESLDCADMADRVTGYDCQAYNQ